MNTVGDDIMLSEDGVDDAIDVDVDEYDDGDNIDDDDDDDDLK